MPLDRATRELVKAALHHALETGESKELLQLMEERRIPSDALLEGGDSIMVIAMKASRTPEDPATKIALCLLDKEKLFHDDQHKKTPCNYLSQLYYYYNERIRLYNLPEAKREQDYQVKLSEYDHIIAHAYLQLGDKENARANYKLVTTVKCSIPVHLDTQKKQIVTATWYVDDLLEQGNQEEAIDWLTRLRQSDRLGFDEYKYSDKCDAIIPITKSRWIFNKALGFLNSMSAVDKEIPRAAAKKEGPEKEAAPGKEEAKKEVPDKALTLVEFLKHLKTKAAKSPYAKKTLIACSKAGSLEQRLLATLLSQRELGAEFKHAELNNFDTEYTKGLQILASFSPESRASAIILGEDAEKIFQTIAQSFLATIAPRQDVKKELPESHSQQLIPTVDISLTEALKKCTPENLERVAYAHFRWATSCCLLASSAAETHAGELENAIALYHFIFASGLYSQLDHFARAEIKEHIITLLDTKHKEKALELLATQLYAEFKLEYPCSMLLNELFCELEKNQFFTADKEFEKISRALCELGKKQKSQVLRTLIVEKLVAIIKSIKTPQRLSFIYALVTEAPDSLYSQLSQDERLIIKTAFISYNTWDSAYKDVMINRYLLLIKFNERATNLQIVFDDLIKNQGKLSLLPADWEKIFLAIKIRFPITVDVGIRKIYAAQLKALAERIESPVYRGEIYELLIAYYADSDLDEAADIAAKLSLSRENEKLKTTCCDIFVRYARRCEESKDEKVALEYYQKAKEYGDLEAHLKVLQLARKEDPLAETEKYKAFISEALAKNNIALALRALDRVLNINRDLGDDANFAVVLSIRTACELLIKQIYQLDNFPRYAWELLKFATDSLAQFFTIKKLKIDQSVIKQVLDNLNILFNKNLSFLNFANNIDPATYGNRFKKEEQECKEFVASPGTVLGPDFIKKALAAGGFTPYSSRYIRIKNSYMDAYKEEKSQPLLSTDVQALFSLLYTQENSQLVKEIMEIVVYYIKITRGQTYTNMRALYQFYLCALETRKDIAINPADFINLFYTFLAFKGVQGGKYIEESESFLYLHEYVNFELGIKYLLGYTSHPDPDIRYSANCTLREAYHHNFKSKLEFAAPLFARAEFLPAIAEIARVEVDKNFLRRNDEVAITFCALFLLGSIKQQKAYPELRSRILDYHRNYQQFKEKKWVFARDCIRIVSEAEKAGTAIANPISYLFNELKDDSDSSALFTKALQNALNLTDEAKWKEWLELILKRGQVKAPSLVVQKGAVPANKLEQKGEHILETSPTPAAIASVGVLPDAPNPDDLQRDDIARSKRAPDPDVVANLAAPGLAAVPPYAPHFMAQHQLPVEGKDAPKAAAPQPQAEMSQGVVKAPNPPPEGKDSASPIAAPPSQPQAVIQVIESPALSVKGNDLRSPAIHSPQPKAEVPQIEVKEPNDDDLYDAEEPQIEGVPQAGPPPLDPKPKPVATPSSASVPASSPASVNSPVAVPDEKHPPLIRQGGEVAVPSSGPLLDLQPGAAAVNIPLQRERKRSNPAVSFFPPALTVQSRTFSPASPAQQRGELSPVPAIVVCQGSLEPMPVVANHANEMITIKINALNFESEDIVVPSAFLYETLHSRIELAVMASEPSEKVTLELFTEPKRTRIKVSLPCAVLKCDDTIRKIANSISMKPDSSPRQAEQHISAVSLPVPIL